MDALNQWRKKELIANYFFHGKGYKHEIRCPKK